MIQHKNKHNTKIVKLTDNNTNNKIIQKQSINNYKKKHRINCHQQQIIVIKIVKIQYLIRKSSKSYHRLGNLYRLLINVKIQMLYYQHYKIKHISINQLIIKVRQIKLIMKIKQIIKYNVKKINISKYKNQTKNINKKMRHNNNKKSRINFNNANLKKNKKINKQKFSQHKKLNKKHKLANQINLNSSNKINSSYSSLKQLKLFSNKFQHSPNIRKGNSSFYSSQSILFQDLQHTSAFQCKPYYQNHKLILTQPILSLNSFCKFRIQNIKYCIGFGIGLQQVIIKHQYDYQSQGNNQLGHGLYIVTSQGFSWSHSQKEQDDILRQGFNQMYNGLTVQVKLNGEELEFKWKKGQFKLTIPSEIRQKYTLCYCAYLHQKQDAISISK